MFRVIFLTALMLTSCQRANSSTPAAAGSPGSSAAAAVTATREILPQPVVQTTEPPPAQTVPPMIVLTQPTAQGSTPQVVTTSRVSKPALTQIDSPGPGSKLRDYVWVRANVYPGDGGNVNLLLTGEDGRVISQRPLIYSTWSAGWLSIAEQLAFSPKAASEKALLSVYTLDWYGRIISLASVPLLLLQLGPEEIELPGFRRDPFVISKPIPGSTLSGGVVHLEGFTHITQPGPVIVEMIGNDGAVIASQNITPTPVPEGDGYTAFTLDLPYQVQKTTPVRLIIRQASPDFPDINLSASSLILFLNP